MPTLFEQIDAGLSGNDLGARLAAQINNLTTVGATANTLFTNPPAAISQLIQSLGSLPLPDTNKLGALPQTITKLQSLVPTDLSGVTDALKDGMADFTAGADKGLIGKVGSLINSLQALEAFLQIIMNLPGTDGSTQSVPIPKASPRKGAVTVETGNSPVTGATSAHAREGLARKAVAATVNGEVNAILQALDRLPEPLVVESLLDGLNFLLNGFNRSIFPTTHLPFVDELAQTLNTLGQWRGMTGVQIATHLEGTLQATAAFVTGQLNGEIQPIANLSATLHSRLPASTLNDACHDLQGGLQTLAQAVSVADLPLINTTLGSLNTLATQFNGILAGLMSDFFSGQSSGLLERLDRFPGQAHASLCNLLTILNPGSDIGLLATLSSRINEAYAQDEIDACLTGYRELLTWLQGLLDQVDFSSIEEPVSAAAGRLQGTVDDLDNLLVDVVTEVSLLFDDVNAAIDQVNTAQIAASIKDAVAAFQKQVESRMEALFTPIKEAITAGINAIEAAAGDFDPEDVIAALRQAIQTLSGILSDPQVLGAIESIRGELDGMTVQLGAISFKPANDVIISQIDEVKGILEAMDTSLLNNALKLALMGAVELLPDEDDLQGVKNGLLAELDQIITSGPATLLAAVRVQPEQLLHKVQAYSPLDLVGEALSAPFQDLLKQFQDLHPSDVFKPVQAALEEIKQTLKEKADPGQFIAPLEGPFAEVLGLFDQLNPQKLIDPLNQAMEQVIGAILEALPIDEVFEIYDAVLSQLQLVVDTVVSLRTLFQRVQSMLTGFEEPETQLTTWINDIVGRLDQVPDTTNMTLAFTQVETAVASLRAQPIVNRLLAALDPLRQSLISLDAQACLTRLIRACRDFPLDAVAGLPMPERQNIENFFVSFDPGQPAISRPLNNLQDLADRLQPFPQTIAGAFVDWDEEYHGPGSCLSGLVPTDTSIPALKSLLRNTIREEVGQPLNAVLKLLPNLNRVVEGFLEIFNEFAGDLEKKLSLLVGGPASLTTIRQAMGELVDTLKGLNFNFLASELEGVFNNVKSKFNAISPAVLRGIVEDAFTAALASLDLDKLLPTAEVSALDAKFAALVTQISQLDPDKLLVEVMQPEFEKAIKPFLEPFDLTGVITAVIGELDRLKADLSTELDRTIASFLAMLDAVPSLELSLDIDVGVDVGF